MIHRLKDIFTRHCDLDKAARNYKKFYALGGTAWASRTAMQLYSVVDMAETLQRQNQDFSLANLIDGSELSLKFAAYSIGWTVLKGVHWTSFAYASVGFAHKRNMV